MIKRFVQYIIAVMILFSPTLIYSDCESESFLDDCASSLAPFTFLKAYKIPNDPSKTLGEQYSYVFSKGTTYKLSVCSDKSAKGQMVFNLYDRNKKLIASTYDKKTKKHFPAVSYDCTATGVYYLSFSFEGDDGCGVGILGFKK